MTIFCLFDDNHAIIETGYNKFNEKCEEINTETTHLVTGYNGLLFLEEYTKTDSYKAAARDYEEQKSLKRLRRRREEECFSIINRGQLWYSKLTASQIEELNTWYAEWLDVTETLIVPTQPEWLENY